jgi:peroxiredoxin
MAGRGTLAPDFEVVVEGRPVRLADLRGQPVILIFLRHLA